MEMRRTAESSRLRARTSPIMELLEGRVLLDATAPIVSAIAVSQIGPHSALITWTSDETATTRVEYGVGIVTELTSIQHSSLLTSHSVLIAGLMPSTLYKYHVISKDGSNNTATSATLNFTTAAIASAGSGSLKVGGLTSYPVYMLGDNLVTNGGMESVSSGNPTGWSDNGGYSPDKFVASSDYAHSGTYSYRVQDPNTISYVQSANQSISLAAGSYRVSGWTKTSGLTNGSTRIGFAGNTGSMLTGTNDWTYQEVTQIVTSGSQNVKLEVYGEPSGYAWWDDIEVRQEISAGVDAFMQYPNYRGMLFSDQSQAARFNVKATAPAGTTLSNYTLRALVVRESDGQTIATQNIPNVLAEQTVNVDGASFANGSTYLVRFQLVRNSDSVVAYEYPAYRISKVDAAKKADMAIYYDQDNRIVVDNQPRFTLGVYDAGMGYTATESIWEDTNFGGYRRLWDLPIDMYLNYWYGEASTTSMNAMMNVLQDHGISYLQTVNNGSFPGNVDDTYTTTLANHDGLAGWYSMDERPADQAPQVYAWHDRLAKLDPDGMTFAVSNKPAQMDYWRDAADMLAMDPYALYGAEPAGGYPFKDVADWTQRTVQAVQASRPIMSVLQYFKFTSNSRWPTQSELRDMSYSAIANGANGLWYWTLGTSGTGTSLGNLGNTTWPETKISEYEKLKVVTREIDGIRDALSAVDSPAKLLGNSNSNIRTRVKYINGIGYLIASNYTNNSQSASFTWDSNPGNVAVYAENRHLIAAGGTFSDTFGPHQAHVYLIAAPGAELGPVVVADTYETRQGDVRLSLAAAQGVLANDIDPDRDSLSASLLAGPSHGVLTFKNDGSFVYRPHAGYVGTDSFTYRAYDGTSFTTGTVLLRSNYALTNAAPAAVANSYLARQNQTLTVAAPGVLANDSDADGDAIWAVRETDVTHGTLNLNADGSFSYAPHAGYLGTDSFAYRAWDGQAYSSPVTVTITTQDIVNNAPVAVGESYSTFENQTLTIAAPGVLANDSDADGDPVTSVLYTNVSHGVLQLNADGSFTYTPSAGYIGGDNFSYRAYDGNAYSAPATVSIAVNEVAAGGYVYDFTTLSTIDAGTGADADYLPGTDLNVITGRATATLLSGRFRIGNGTIGAGWSGETSGQQRDVTLVNRVTGAGVYFASTDASGSTSSTNRAILFGAQDKANYLAVRLHNSLYNSSLGVSRAIEIVRCSNGTETYLAGADITVTSETIGLDDVEVTIQWTPGSNNAGTANVTVLWRSADLQTTHYSGTFANVDLSAVPWIGGRLGVREDGGYLGNIYVRKLSYTPFGAPSFQSWLVNDGSPQRSMVNSMDVAFSEPVTLGADALSLATRAGAAVPGVTTTITPLNEWTYRLSFSGAAVIGDSLPDGIYRLVIRGASVHNAYGIAMTGDQTRSFHRLFGDSDGDRDVDKVDLAQFKSSLNREAQYLWYFDFDNDGEVNVLDYTQFKQRLVRRPIL